MLNWIIHPLKSLKAWGIKSYVLSIVNTALEQYGESVNTARAYVQIYAAKVEALLAFLKSLDAKLLDSKLTAEEADEICEEAVRLGDELVR